MNRDTFQEHVRIESELDDLPCETDRHRNKASQLLGEVYRLKIPEYYPPNEYREIGVVNLVKGS